MLIYILNYWRKQTGKERIFLILVFLLLVLAAQQTISKAWYKYKYFKEVENNYNELLLTIEEANKAEELIIASNKEQTIKAKKKSSDIDLKLKADEKIIDNSDVSDNELLEFLSKHQKR